LGGGGEWLRIETGKAGLGHWGIGDGCGFEAGLLRGVVPSAQGKRQHRKEQYGQGGRTCVHTFVFVFQSYVHADRAYHRSTCLCGAKGRHMKRSRMCACIVMLLYFVEEKRGRGEEKRSELAKG